MTTITQKILSGIKEAYDKGEKVTIDLKEASSLTGSGSGVGGSRTGCAFGCGRMQGGLVRLGHNGSPVGRVRPQGLCRPGSRGNRH